MIKILCAAPATDDRAHQHSDDILSFLWLEIAHVSSWIFQNKTKTMFVRNIFVSGSNDFGYCVLFAIPIALQFARNESSPSLQFLQSLYSCLFHFIQNEVKRRNKKLILCWASPREKIAYPYISSCRHAPKIGTKKHTHNWISRFDRTRTSFWIIGSRSVAVVFILLFLLTSPSPPFLISYGHWPAEMEIDCVLRKKICLFEL